MSPAIVNTSGATEVMERENSSNEYLKTLMKNKQGPNNKHASLVL